MIFWEITDVAARRNSGEPIDLSTIDLLTWKLLIIYDSEIEFQERNLRIYSRLLLEALGKRGY